MANTATEATQPTEDVRLLACSAQQIPLVGEERTVSGVPLVGEDDVAALVQAGHARGVAAEMAVVLGFLREKPFHLPAADPRPPSTWSSSTHPRGSAFLGLELFRDWVRVPEEDKVTWCKSKLVLNNVFKNVRDFLMFNIPSRDRQGTNSTLLTSQGQTKVTDVKYLNSNYKTVIPSNCSTDTRDNITLLSGEDETHSVNSRTSVMESELLFDGDSEEVQAAVIEVLLTHVPRSLYVFTGSTHVGYRSLTTQRPPHRVKLPAPDPSHGAPKTYALLFQLPAQTRGLRNCVLYPSSETVEKFINSSNEKEKLLKLEEDTKGAYVDKTVLKLTPLLCERLSDINTRFDKTRGKKQRLAGIFVNLDKETKSLVLSVPRNIEAYKLQIIENNIKELVTKEKKALQEEVTSFSYPEDGSDVILKLGAGGSVLNATKDSSLVSSRNLTVMLYACAKVGHNFDTSSLEENYGLVERLPEPENLSTDTHKPFLWGMVHCTSREKFEGLLNEHPGIWRGSLPHNMRAAWQRPAVPLDGNFLPYLRIPIKQPLQVIDRVILKKRDASWNPASFPHGEVPIGMRSYRYVGRGRGRGRGSCRYVHNSVRHKVLWFGDGTGSFKLRGYHNITKKDKLIEEVRNVYGQHVDISFETKPLRRRHYCFSTQTNLASTLNNLDASLVSGSQHWIDVKPSLDEIDEYEEISLNFSDVSRGIDFLSSLQAQNTREHHDSQHTPLCKDGFIFGTPLFCLSTMLRPGTFHSIRDNLTSFFDFIKEKKFDVNVSVSKTKSNKMSLTVSGGGRMVVEEVGKLLQDLLKPELINLAEEGFPTSDNAIFFLNSAGGKDLLDNIEKMCGAKVHHDPSNHTVTMFGSKSSRRDAMVRLLEDLKQLPVPERVHIDKEHLVIPMLKLIMKTYKSDLSDLCREIKPKGLIWNHKENCFMVWGSTESVEALSSKAAEVCSMLEDSATPSDGSTCSACLCPVEEEVVELTMCGHLYCSSCLDLQVDIAIRDRNLPISCVAHECEELLLMSDINDACVRMRGGTRHLLDAAVRLHIAQQGKESLIAHCPTPDCPAVYFVSNKAAITGQKITCFFCKASMCNMCHVTPFHDDYTCAMWKNRQHVDRPTAGWFSKDVKDRKQCPACAVGIERISGCYNVQCGNCHRSICFECGRAFGSSSACYAHKCRGTTPW